MAAAREDKRKAEEEDASPDQKADETETEMAAFVDECSDDDDEDDPVIRNLNLMGRRKLVTPEWIERRKKHHYEHLALLDRVYEALENGEIESDSSDEGEAEPSKGPWASVDMSRVNAVDGEYAVAVYPVGLYPRRSRPETEEEKDQCADAAAAS